MEEKVLRDGSKADKIFPVKDGYVLCPKCLAAGIRNKLQEAPPDMKAIRLRLYCRQCKSRYIVNIAEGQCREDQS